jgi:DNA mismatch repair protein MSH6
MIDSKGRSRDDPNFDARSVRVPSEFMAKQTPGHKLWWEFKQGLMDCVLLFKARAMPLLPSLACCGCCGDGHHVTASRCVCMCACVCVYVALQVGKFYETYHMDADVLVKELDLVYMKGDIAHAGFPEIAYGKMSNGLVERGFRCAVQVREGALWQGTVTCWNV